jgi:hypothetical protein
MSFSPRTFADEPAALFWENPDEDIVPQISSSGSRSSFCWADSGVTATASTRPRQATHVRPASLPDFTPVSPGSLDRCWAPSYQAIP